MENNTMKSISREDEIKTGYKKNASKYDDYITSERLWSRVAVNIIWGMRDDEYVNPLLSMIPNELQGKLLDVPAGTAIFTYEKYKQMRETDIFCLDYSQEMLDHAVSRLQSSNITNVRCTQGDVGNMPFEDNFFDVVLSMNGIHAFPDKQKAFEEINRVLKTDGKFLGCCYIKGERKSSDFFVRNIFVKNGTFTPPFMTKKELELQLKEKYKDVKVWNVKSIAYFECTKK